jgi:hypothetical protein
MVKDRARDHFRRYAADVPPELESSFFVMRDLEPLFTAAGWRLEVHGWPGPVREWLRDRVELLRHGRRTARFPALVARRER